jgi:hypothetical protein
MGTVGPKLAKNMPKASWTVVGVPYNADVAGDNCVGLPGGMIAKNMLESAASKCPNSYLFTSGYSQGKGRFELMTSERRLTVETGAMVARIAVAYASPATKARVKVSVWRGA